MSDLVISIDDKLASQLKQIASEQHDGDQNAVISDALLLLFLQPIKPGRKKLAGRIYDIRESLQKAGSRISENDIDTLIMEYRHYW